MTPSVGRIVHYVSHGTPVREDGTQAYTSQCRAAIITAVKGAITEITGLSGEPAPLREPVHVVSLCVLNPDGLFLKDEILQQERDHGGGSWHWPERTEG